MFSSLFLLRYGRRLLITFLLAATLPAAAMPEAEDMVVTRSGGATQYVELKPSFVANFGGVGGLRYLRADIVLRVGGGDEGLNGVRRHMPYNRHVLVMLLSSQQDDAIATMEGRELLRQQALSEVRAVLLAEERQHFVDDLLFNSFIVQR